MKFGYNNTFQMIDKGVIESFGPSGFSFNVLASSKSVAGFQSGIVTNYTLTLIVAVLVLLSTFSFIKLGLITSL
jgi:hypothetical protein